MADHLLPTLDSTYTLFLSELSTRVDDAVKQSRSDTVALTNPPVGTIRWNTLSAKWESNTGTVGIPEWTALTATYGINVATANSWATGRTIALTGDVTGTSGAWTGSGNISFSVALASVNANVGAFGGTAAVPIITVNAKGLVTAVSTAALGSMATQSANSVAVTGGAISATAITLVGAPAPVPTVEGRMEWDTEDNKLKIGDGAGTKVFTPDDLVATLLNKSMGEGCTWDGTAVLVANGGTGATTASDARANLGLGNVNDTSDANKPVSTAQQISLNLKADIASPVFTGTPAAPTATAGTNTTQVATTAHVFAERANTATLTNKTLTSPTLTTPALGTPASGNLANCTFPTLNQNTTGNAATATSLSGGTAGAVPYQSAAGTTGYTAAGTAGQVLTSAGAAAPTWTSVQAFAAGTRMPFAQVAAPTGWTQDVSDAANNRMLRVVNTAGGGVAGTHSPILNNVVPAHTHGFTTGTVSSDHSHSSATHTHTILQRGSGEGNAWSYGFIYTSGNNTDTGQNYHTTSSTTPGNTGGISANHTHSGSTDNGSSQTNWAPRYIDMIICSKN